MPLTLSLYGSSPYSGYVIIDRNNLIFAYPKESPLYSDPHIPYNLRNMVNRILPELKLVDLYSTKRTFVQTSDPRHTALEHMSIYDRYLIHTHIIFKNDIDMTLIEYIFKHPAFEQIPEIMSGLCVKNILSISKEYFSDLKNPAAQVIEQDYRREKEREYKQCEREIINEQGKKCLKKINEETVSGYFELVLLAANANELDLLLMRYNKDILNITDDNGCTALHSSIADNVNAAERLVKAGADVDYENQWGRTPLFIAVIKNNMPGVSMLLSHRANANHRDKNGDSPLILAARDNHIDIVFLLILANADFNCEVTKGVSIYDWAVSNNHSKIVMALLGRPDFNHTISLSSSSRLSALTQTFKKPVGLINRQIQIQGYILKLKEISKNNVLSLNAKQIKAFEQFDLLFKDITFTQVAANYLKSMLCADESFLEFLKAENQLDKIDRSGSSVRPSISNKTKVMQALFRRIDLLVPRNQVQNTQQPQPSTYRPGVSKSQ